MPRDLFFLVNVAVVISLLILSTATFIKVRRTKALQNKLIQSLNTVNGASWFRIRLARPAYFHRRLKLVGFESSGILINNPDYIRVLAEFDTGEKFDRTYPKDNLHLRWIGNPGLGSANMHWLSLGQGSDQLMISADTGFNAVQSREATADICRMIDTRFTLPDLAKTDFALEKNKASLSIVILFFALLAYALIDGAFVNKNELLSIGKLRWVLPGLAVLALPSYYFLVRSKVPSRESLTLSLLLTSAFVAAFIPLAKRADQLLSDGPRSYDYKLMEGARLEPLSPGLPPLTFSRTKDYWAQFEQGSIHHFDLIHGPLGMWQLDWTALTPKLKTFYTTQDHKK